MTAARYKLEIEYDGAAFAGWQRVGEGLLSVQGALEAACAALCGQACDVIGAGRTDAGVHAFGQAAHVDLPRAYRPDTVRDALNAHLRPHAIAILGAERADPEFHARFHAVRRVYRYRIINRRADLALERGRAWRIPVRLDASAMQAAAETLIGQHDFTTFRDTQCQANSPVRTLDVLTVARAGDEILIHAEARSFLHRQVRSMVGTLAEAGMGRRSPADVAQALAARDRAACGQVAPPDGLYLLRVDYPNAEK